MSKRATISRVRFLAGALAALPVLLAGAAQAQQAYYFPQGSSAPVSVNYGALTPYAPAPVPGAFQPYGYAVQGLSSRPKSVFTPYGQPAYPVPAYVLPGYVQPGYVQPGYVPTTYGYAATTLGQRFVAPYANPSFASLPSGARGLPLSTPTSSGQPVSYLNVPGQDDGGATKPIRKKHKKKKAAAEQPMPPSTPTATEEAAAAQVAAAEAVLESGPVTPPAEPVAAAEPAAPAEPATPPAEPTEVPATVPSPADAVPAAAVPADAAPADAAATGETSTQQTASVAPAAETAPAADAAALPAGATRILFEGQADDLPQGATGDLDAIADRMLADENIKVQVLAYASGDPAAESQARRKALARGLEVRKYLIGKGVRSNRIDVRALGSKAEGGPPDRVDIVPAAG